MNFTFSDNRAGICSRRIFTLIEMLMVIAIIAILAAMLSPALRRALDSGNSVACQNNLRQQGILNMTYVDDWHGVIPTTTYIDSSSKPDAYSPLYAKWVRAGYIAETDGILMCPATGMDKDVPNDDVLKSKQLSVTVQDLSWASKCRSSYGTAKNVLGGGMHWQMVQDYNIFNKMPRLRDFRKPSANVGLVDALLCYGWLGANNRTGNSSILYSSAWETDPNGMLSLSTRHSVDQCNAVMVDGHVQRIWRAALVPNVTRQYFCTAVRPNWDKNYSTLKR